MSAFLNQQRPEARNDFWSKPEVEIDIAASAGVQARAPRGKRAALRCVTASKAPAPQPAPRVRQDTPAESPRR